MHSPPRAVSVKDQQDWKIPPCISNWKNQHGYTIPLDKRLAADGAPEPSAAPSSLVLRLPCSPVYSRGQMRGCGRGHRAWAAGDADQ